MSQQQLHEHIISLSKATSWHSARDEWDLDSIYRSDEPESCPCGQYPIIEICVIRNRLNGNTTEVGNVCVNNFLNLPSDKLFQSVRYVSEDAGRSFSEDMIDYACRKRIISQWERDLYMDIRRKRKLSGKQRAKKDQVNQKILAAITR